jgi:hypothetical protein
MPAVRIGPEEAYRKAKSGEAILVCAYDDETSFETMHLDMALSFGEFRKLLPGLSKEREIIFYCA